MSRKRRYSITANDKDVVPVLASYIPTKKGKTPVTHLAYLSCEACNTEVLGSNTVNPFCVCCASEMKPTSDKTLEVPGTEIDTEFETVAECPECATVIKKRTDIEASFDDNALYCPTCTTKLNVVAADDDEDEDDDKDKSGDDDMTDTVDSDQDNGGDSLFDNDAGEGDADSTTDNNSTDSTDSGTDSADSTDGTSSDNTDKSSTDTTDNANAGGSTLNANLVQALSGKTGDVSVVASPDKTKWFLFLDNTPVATATKDNASDNVKSFFDSDKFASSWNAATTDGVTEDLLNDFGFTANTVDVPVDEAVKQNLEASIAEEKKKISITAAEIQQRFERCFGIAAVGINKNVFKENNPVKHALIASLKSRNVRDAEKIVTAAFSEHGEEMLANVSEKAAELMDKTDETLDEMAKAVDEAKQAKSEDKNEGTSGKEEKKPAPKLTTFPKSEEDKPKDEAPKNDNDNGNEHALAASDVDNVFDRMARRLRRQ